ncbi:MAG TPA: hypothetical protein VMF89_07380 [Polyangiales bacterium]|nr:hypothetical protein [Polyangiales bacterium]
MHRPLDVPQGLRYGFETSILDVDSPQAGLPTFVWRTIACHMTTY